MISLVAKKEPMRNSLKFENYSTGTDPKIIIHLIYSIKVWGINDGYALERSIPIEYFFLMAYPPEKVCSDRDLK